jgi:hypothetical protein
MKLITLRVWPDVMWTGLCRLTSHHLIPVESARIEGRYEPVSAWDLPRFGPESQKGRYPSPKVRKSLDPLRQ